MNGIISEHNGPSYLDSIHSATACQSQLTGNGGLNTRGHDYFRE